MTTRAFAPRLNSGNAALLALDRPVADVLLVDHERLREELLAGAALHARRETGGVAGPKAESNAVQEVLWGLDEEVVRGLGGLRGLHVAWEAGVRLFQELSRPRCLRRWHGVD